MDCRRVLRALPAILTLLVGLCGFVQANPLAQFRTTFGTIEVELLRDQRPETVANFVHYVESGRYQGTFFHRLQPNFLLAGGCYIGADRRSTNAAYLPVTQYKSITNETKRGGVLTNYFGTLALGQVSNGSNRLGSEFFFSLSDASAPFFTQNQGGYPVFGRIRSGLEIIQKLNTFQALRQVRLATNVLISIFDPNLPEYLYGTSQFPVLRFDPTFDIPDQLENLVYLDITLLNVSVTRLPTGTQIGWDSVTGRTNVVEFTRTFPPVWETLSRVKGTGARMAVNDPSVESRRFHRVRVEY